MPWIGLVQRFLSRAKLHGHINQVIPYRNRIDEPSPLRRPYLPPPGISTGPISIAFAFPCILATGYWDAIRDNGDWRV